MENKRNLLFEEASVKKAVLILAVPTVISQLITVVYNMADTFFIGQLNDPLQVAAATVAMPCFMLLTAFANLFGIGGASLISRCLGVNDTEKARQTASFAIWTGAGTAFLYGVALLLLEPIIFPVLGANGETQEYLRQYMFWTITVGAVPTVMNSEFAHLIRAEGYSKQAAFGVALGGILNIILDPIFIFTFNMKIEGAAIATMLSNVIATVYFIAFLLKKRKSTAITLNIKKYTLKHGIPSEVVAVGLPGFIMTVMSTVSNTVLNHIVAGYSNVAIAGMGIAKKIDMLAYAIAQGMAQGVLPFIGYNYSSNNIKRMKKGIYTSFLYSLIVAVCGTVLLFFFAPRVISYFIAEAQTVHYGQLFLRIICLACPTTAVNFMIITVLQAVGEKRKPLFLSLLRKGSIDVLLMLLLNASIGINGIALATPLADLAAFVISVALITPYIRKIK